MTFLTIKKVSGALLITILGLTLTIGLIIPSEGSMVTSIPDGIVSLPSGISETFLKLKYCIRLRTFRKSPMC